MIVHTLNFERFICKLSISIIILIRNNHVKREFKLNFIFYFIIIFSEIIVLYFIYSAIDNCII